MTININIGQVSYTLAAVAFILLSLLLLTSWRGRIQGALLAVAAVASALWTVVLAYGMAGGSEPGLVADLMEELRSAAWFFFLIKLLETRAEALDEKSVQRMHMLVRLVVTLFALLLPATLIFHIWPGLFGGQVKFGAGIIARVIIAIIGMALVEQLYRNARAEQRWAIQYLCLGVGGMFAYDFYLYADAMLFKHVDVVLWSARGFVNALVVPFVALSAARNPDWSLDVFVSRHIVFHSVTLIGAGVYLLVMAAAGYYIRVFGGSWGPVVQAAFFFGALLVLLAVLFSGTLRASMKVFLGKHFFSYKYDYREKWLHFTRTLSEIEPGVRLRERSIQAIAELVESPGGALWLAQDSENFTLVAQWNMSDARDNLPIDSSLSRFLENRQWVINLDEYETQPDMYEDLEIPRWLLEIPRAWLVMPLILHERLLGFIVLARSRGLVDFNYEDSDLLKTAGRQMAVYLGQMQTAAALMEARQFESFSRLSAFVVHDLKNVITQLSLISANAVKHKSNPEFQDDMISTVDNSVRKMQRLMQQLRGSVPGPANAIDINLDDLLRSVAQEKARLKPAPQLFIEQGALFIKADPERLTRVIGHLVQNAIEATAESGRVDIRLALQEGSAVIEVADTGAGMDDSFVRERLFRPFETTKDAGMGIGVYECREYVRELGGRIEVISRVAQGTTFYIRLPLSVAAAPEQSGEVRERVGSG